MFEPVELVGTWNEHCSRFDANRKEGHSGPQWMLNAGMCRPSSQQTASKFLRHCIILAMSKDFATARARQQRCDRPNGRGTAKAATAMDSPTPPGSAYREQLAR